MPIQNKGSRRLPKKFKTRLKRFEVDRWGDPITTAKFNVAPSKDGKYWRQKQTSWHRRLFGPDQED